MDTWHESDEFWSSFAPMMFGPPQWEAASADVEGVIRLLGLAAGAAVLDLGCGPGRHSLELARRGFRVTGVDRTVAYLEQAREPAAAEALSVEFVLEDMRHFSRPEAFDAVLSLYTSFGYFEDPAENRAVLVNACRSLRAGGALLLEIMGKEVLARIFQERDWVEQEGLFFLQERRVSRDWSWMENRWILLGGPEPREFRVCHWLYSAVELAALLRESGFASVESYGDLEGAPYDHRARRLVIVARK